MDCTRKKSCIMQKMLINNVNFQLGQDNSGRAVCALRAGGGPWAVTWPWENETRAGGQEMELLEFLGREKQAGKSPRSAQRFFFLFSHGNSHLFSCQENLSVGL